jgi:hypothetical protein
MEVLARKAALAAKLPGVRARVRRRLVGLVAKVSAVVRARPTGESPKTARVTP